MGKIFRLNFNHFKIKPKLYFYSFSYSHYLACYTNMKGEYNFRIFTTRYFTRVPAYGSVISKIVQSDLPMSFRDKKRYIKLSLNSYRKNKIRQFINLVRRLEKWT